MTLPLGNPGSTTIILTLTFLQPFDDPCYSDVCPEFLLQTVMKTLVLGVIFMALCLGVDGNYDNYDIAEMKAKMDAMERRLAVVEQQQSKRLKWYAMG